MVFLSLCLPLAPPAGSFSLNEQSVSGLGVAFASGAADPSGLFFNPAGIVLLEQGELQASLHAIIPRAEFSNRGSFYNLPSTLNLLDAQGHQLVGKFDASVNIVSAAVTFRWGGPKQVAPTYGKDAAGYRK